MSAGDGFAPFTLQVPFGPALACAGSRRGGRWLVMAHAYPEIHESDADFARAKAKLLKRVQGQAVVQAIRDGRTGARPPGS